MSGVDKIARLTDDGVVLVRGSDISPQPISWLWRDWLARGKVHILAGAAGQGKTTIAMALVATVTSGGRWPDGSRAEQGNVLIWSGEDDPADTLLPRLMAAGADRSRVYFVRGARIAGEEVPFDPARDLVQLTSQAKAIGDVRLVIVDPVVSAVAGDTHKNGEVRRGLQPLVDLAANVGAALLGISHFSKGSAGREPTERVTGSLAFGAVARVVMYAAKAKSEEEGTDRRVFGRSKSNIGPDSGGFEYSLEQVEASPGIEASRVLWGRSVEGSARELLAEAEAEDEPHERNEREEACDFLRDLLAAGPVAAKQVQAEARDAGVSTATLRRAQLELEIKPYKDGVPGGRGGWFWSLPDPRCSPSAKDAHANGVSILGKGEHLEAGEDF
ncbi:AAA family ATPase [Piscinibacter koreensis]|uniref:AAA family ATPase n=1 Tax=Piscinibacter koreensis TaxID=2742824 RepID=A0A7Y6NP78_9BURK|nr:AAA family ATPase [Schlegelella koreensis]NUZ06746.1 AAA family ATPase [Schlegelella koreensis]